MRYEIYGPYLTPKTDAMARGKSLATFWSEVEADAAGLSGAIGIYVFSTCHGENYTPWYVGKTNSKKGFRGEIFQDHKLSHYISATQLKKGYPTIHLIAKLQPARPSFCRPSDRSGREIDELETVIIGMALRANREVRNSKKTWFNKNCSVPGIIGDPVIGRPTGSMATLRNALSL